NWPCPGCRETRGHRCGGRAGVCSWDDAADAAIAMAQVHRSIRTLVPLGGVALLVVLFLQLGPARILELLESIGWNFPVIVGLYCCHESVRAFAVSACLPPGARVPVRQLVRLQFFTEAVRTLTHTGQFVSEPARAWLLTRQGISGSHASAAAISELIVNSGTSAVVTVGALVYFLHTMLLPPPLAAFARVLAAVSAGYIVIVVTAVISRTYVVGALIGAARVVPAIARLIDPGDVRKMEDAIHRVLRERPVTLARVALLELAAQS